MKANKLAKLRRKTYRDAYVKSMIEQGLAFQIKEMRLSRGLTQRELAAQLDLRSQSAVARLEDPSYGRITLSTLAKVAAFFDVAFMAKMVPYSRFLDETKDLTPEGMVVASFEREDEVGAIENAPELLLCSRLSVGTSRSTYAMPFSPSRRTVSGIVHTKALPLHSTTKNITIDLVNFSEHANAA